MSTPAERDFDELVDSDPDAQSGDDVALGGSRLDDWWERLGPRWQRILGWSGPVLVVIVAAATRLWNLGNPKTLIFDETFYVKDAWSLIHLGYEAQWPAESDPMFNAGQVNGYLTDPSFIVHPPLGKWIIGIGMQIFGGDNPVGWRISTAIVGILAVVLLMLIARYLFKSVLLATVAGLLMAIEGNAIVMSRIALLDNSVMFLALLGFGAILLDRRWTSQRLGRWVARREGTQRSIDWGPALWWRPWLILAGLAFGLTASVKWSGLYFLASFAVYTLVVDAVARRRAGIGFWVTGTIFRQGPATFLLTVPIAVAGYLATWAGWFASSNGYYRYWADASAGNAWTGPLAWVPHTIQSFWHFETAVYSYHVNEMRPHGYQANPLTWLFMVRPTSMFYQGDAAGVNGCAFSDCGTSITGLANPIIWWAATAAVLYLLYRLVRYREWRVGLILAGVAAGYLPWLLYLNRTVFQFYTIAFEPYMLLALTFVIGLILGSARDPRWKRTSGIRIVGIFLGIAALLSVFFWPLWAGIQLDYWYLASHWWLPTWR